VEKGTKANSIQFQIVPLQNPINTIKNSVGSQLELDFPYCSFFFFFSFFLCIEFDLIWLDEVFIGSAASEAEQLIRITGHRRYYPTL
jgi:hypothetical protein